MNDIEAAANFPPAYLIALVVATLAAATAMTPRGLRLYTALSSTTFLLTASRLPGLGQFAMLAKLTSGPALIIVATAASFHPGPRRGLSRVALLYPALALVSVLLVSGAADWKLAMAVQAQWFAMSVAALLIVRCAVDTNSLLRILRAALGGLVAGCAVALSSVVFAPHTAFSSSYGRFTPYESNPNQIAIAFGLTASLGLFVFASSHGINQRFRWSVVTALAAAACMLCVSRLAIGVTALACAPTAIRLCRRPLIAIMFLAVSLTAMWRLLSVDDRFNLSHIEAASEGGRWDWTQEAMVEIQSRPLFGLLFSDGVYAQEPTLNAHNAFVEMAYLGGGVLAVPLALLSVYTLYRAGSCVVPWRRPRYDRRILSVLAALYAGTVASGLVNNIIFYPTYTWALLHLILGALFLSNTDVARMSAARRPSGYARKTTSRPTHGRRRIRWVAPSYTCSQTPISSSA